MMQSSLQINRITKSFSKAIVLNDLSISVESNEIFGLVGLNGIGKTTLIKIILGLLQQDSGDVRAFGKPNFQLEAKKNICYLPEKFQPSAFLTGEEFLKLAISYYGRQYDEHEAIKLCQDLDLDSQSLSKRIGKLSKGMGQKLGLVSVFLSKAPLLILDEPMSGLDPRARICLKDKIKSYKLQGNSVFFSSHILADIEEICDTMAILHSGKINYQGSVDEFIKRHNKKNLEQAFLTSIAA